MRYITSLVHPDIKLAASLHHAKYRKKLGLFSAEGIRTCLTFIENGYSPHLVFATEKMYAELPTSVQNKPFIRLVSETLIEKISQTTSPSGLVTIFPIPATPSLATAQSGIVLVDISDPGNMGTLIRTCVALGKKTVVIIDGADVWSSKVILASAGTLAKASIFQTTWSTLVSQSTLPRSALVVEDGIPLQNAPTLEGLLIIGNEAHGIPESYLAQCTQKVTIEMPGKTESLNAAIAGSIAMYCAWIAKK